jgi:hypothetical protein
VKMPLSNRFGRKKDEFWWCYFGLLIVLTVNSSYFQSFVVTRVESMKIGALK